MKIVVGIFFTFLILALASCLEITVTSRFDFLPSGVTSQIGIFILSIILISVFSKNRIIEFHIRKLKLKQLIYPIIFTVILLIISQLISIFIKEKGHPVADSMSLFQKLLFIVIFASISEELLFRGFLQNMLNSFKSYGVKLFHIKVSVPVLISGFLFGLMHFGMLGAGASFRFVIQIVVAGMLVGMIAGYYQEKYNNFLFAFFVHMTANLSGLILSGLS
jgi:membrane protease YdiL (CAAX protease family)